MGRHPGLELCSYQPETNARVAGVWWLKESHFKFRMLQAVRWLSAPTPYTRWAFNNLLLVLFFDLKIGWYTIDSLDFGLLYEWKWDLFNIVMNLRPHNTICSVPLLFPSCRLRKLWFFILRYTLHFHVWGQTNRGLFAFLFRPVACVTCLAHTSSPWCLLLYNLALPPEMK